MPQHRSRIRAPGLTPRSPMIESTWLRARSIRSGVNMNGANSSQNASSSYHALIAQTSPARAHRRRDLLERLALRRRCRELAHHRIEFHAKGVGDPIDEVEQARDYHDVEGLLFGEVSANRIQVAQGEPRRVYRKLLDIREHCPIGL